MGTKWGLITFFGDFMKSFLAAVLVGWLFGGKYAYCILLLRLYAGAGAVVAHDFPFYMNFKGGKGVAASAGMAMGFRPILLAIGLAVFLGVPSRQVCVGGISSLLCGVLHRNGGHGPDGTVPYDTGAPD